jgi:hypothetical protein
MNYRFGYRNSMKAAFVVDTPGPTPAHVLHLPFHNMQRPFYPFEEEIQSLHSQLYIKNANVVL